MDSKIEASYAEVERALESAKASMEDNVNLAAENSAKLDRIADAADDLQAQAVVYKRNCAELLNMVREKSEQAKAQQTALTGYAKHALAGVFLAAGIKMMLSDTSDDLMLGPVDNCPTSPIFPTSCGLTAGPMDAAVKPRHVGGGGKCQHTLDFFRKLFDQGISLCVKGLGAYSVYRGIKLLYPAEADRTGDESMEHEAGASATVS